MLCSVKRLLAVALMLGLVLSVATPGMGAGQSIPAAQCESTALVFVELRTAPMVEAGPNVNAHRNKLMAEQNSFRQAMSRAGIAMEERFSYSRLFNGFSIAVGESDVEKLMSMPGVVAIYPVLEMPIPEVNTSTGLINAPTVVEDLEYDGSGVLVAVIDTGIDYNHPDLGGGWGNRVVGGWDFVGDDFNASDPTKNVPAPNPDPMDPNGHGTHVAGIIGANGVITGVAPGVDFLALKVFGATGSTTSDILLAALEMAYEMGADVVNMSLGAAFQWPQYPSAIASDRLVQKGVVVVVSQGNSGANGVYAGGAPSVASKVLAVASFDNTHSNQNVFLLPDGTPVGYAGMAHCPPMPTEGTSPEVVYVGLGNTPEDYEGIDVAGKVVLISRGLETFAHKTTMAMERGAAYVLIHNNGPGNFSGTMGAPGDWIPAASISLEHATIMLNMMADGPINLTWTDEEMAFPSPTAGFISSFSSWGPTPDLQVKPDVGAPGGSIYATYPLAFGGYATLSGTSMAAPHVAGAAALMLEANPKLRPMPLGHILRNTAVPQFYQGLPFIEPVHRQGAGMIDVLAAITTVTKVEPSKVSLGMLTEPGMFELKIENISDQDLTYHLSHVPSIMTNNAVGVPPGLYLIQAALDMPDTVVVPAGAEVTIEVGVTPPALPLPFCDGWIYSGYVVIVPDEAGPPVSVPYLGVYGDYFAAPVLGEGNFGFPWLTFLEDDTYYKVDELTIDVNAGETAFILYNLARQARNVRVEVIGPNGRNFGRVFDEDYVGRNADGNVFFNFEWDGSGRHGLVSSGVYHLRLSALKPLGDSENPDHWDVWVSGPITVINE